MEQILSVLEVFLKDPDPIISQYFGNLPTGVAMRRQCKKHE
jgi:hypothetical protein